MLGASERSDGQQEPGHDGPVMGQEFVFYSESNRRPHEGVEHKSDVFRFLQLMCRK